MIPLALQRGMYNDLIRLYLVARPEGCPIDRGVPPETGLGNDSLPDHKNGENRQGEIDSAAIGGGIIGAAVTDFYSTLVGISYCLLFCGDQSQKRQVRLPATAGRRQAGRRTPNRPE